MDDKPYEYQPYPKMLYHPNGETCIVADEDEHTVKMDEGFLLHHEWQAQIMQPVRIVLEDEEDPKPSKKGKGS